MLAAVLLALTLVVIPSFGRYFSNFLSMNSRSSEFDKSQDQGHLNFERAYQFFERQNTQKVRKDSDRIA